MAWTRDVNYLSAVAKELARRLSGEPFSLEMEFLRALEQAAAAESGEEASDSERIDAYRVATGKLLYSTKPLGFTPQLLTVWGD